MSRRSALRERRQAQIRRRRLAYGAIMAGLALILGLIIVALRGNQPVLDDPASTDIMTRGQQIYEQDCAACHGPNGEGHAAVPETPALNETEHVWHHTDGRLQQIILDGAKLMPAFGDQLSRDDVIAVVRYFQSWWRQDQLTAQQERSQTQPFMP
ncbi:MAG: cytochrome c [Chloroflexi bacterium]|nr:cytochrome c [Chloroflexota bacterium]